MTAEVPIPLWADLLAIAVGGVQGALFAAQFRARRLDLLGVAIIGLAAALGGGIIRDLLLNQVPVALQQEWFIAAAVVAAFLGMLLERLFSRLGWLITGLDALTIGLFCAIGTSKAIDLGLPAGPAIFVGAVSAVGGSIIRDLLLGVPIALMYVGSLYAIAAIAGGGTLVILIGLGVPSIIAAPVCVAVTFGVRVLAVLFKWSLPEQVRIERMPRLPRVSKGGVPRRGPGGRS